MNDKLKVFWETLPATTRRRITLLTVGGVLITVATVGYITKDKTVIAKDNGRKAVNLEPDLLKQSSAMESQKEISRRDEKLTELQKQLEELVKTGKVPPGMANMVPAASNAQNGSASQDGKTVSQDGKAASAVPGLPPGMASVKNGSRTSQQEDISGSTASGRPTKNSSKHAPGTIPPLPPGVLPPPPGLGNVATGPDGQAIIAAPVYSEIEVGDISVFSGDKEAIAASAANKKKR